MTDVQLFPDSRVSRPQKRGFPSFPEICGIGHPLCLSRVEDLLKPIALLQYNNTQFKFLYIYSKLAAIKLYKIAKICGQQYPNWIRRLNCYWKE